MDEGPTPVEIRRGPAGSKRRSLRFHGEHWRYASSDVLREAGLHDGDVVEPATLGTELDALEPRVARQRALRLLAARERTCSELVGRLIEDGYGEVLARDTVDCLASTGLVDDVRFAESLARTLVGVRNLGRNRALRELLGRGVPEDLALAALDGLAPRDAEGVRAREAAGRMARANDTIPRLASRLVRRGFTPSEAYTAARDILPDTTGDPDLDVP